MCSLRSWCLINWLNDREFGSCNNCLDIWQVRNAVWSVSLSGLQSKDLLETVASLFKWLRCCRDTKQSDRRIFQIAGAPCFSYLDKTEWSAARHVICPVSKSQVIKMWTETLHKINVLNYMSALTVHFTFMVVFKNIHRKLLSTLWLPTTNDSDVTQQPAVCLHWSWRRWMVMEDGGTEYTLRLSDAPKSRGIMWHNEQAGCF